LKDPEGVKVLAFKVQPTNKNKYGQPVIKDRRDDTPPGNNSPQEVRDAQRNLVACGIEVGIVGESDEGVVFVDHVMQDVLEMITPNTAYVTGPPTMGQIKESFSDSGRTKQERDDYWNGQRGGHDT